MDLETLGGIVRELVRKITDRGDERALDELIDLILDLREHAREIRLIAQIIHDEKTYVLSDTEILRGEERRLIDVAATYHSLYTLCRAVTKKEDLGTDIDLEKILEACTDKNLSDLTLMLERSFYKILSERSRESAERTIKIIDEAISKINAKGDLRSHLMRSLLAEARRLIEKLAERALV
ncbi:MAG: hypothetical protein GXO23_01060 [Crenarchaeota archaeon]|nr:hypothetical protein [Thermoproteota archaeon]